ncbi:hypothetical protein LXA43DRAFT_200438 [Ganoderma leucocontextum]|nr:hypothetical protein LXA43DRAFT_200438 [Ganoderma leucocontextum]
MATNIPSAPQLSGDAMLEVFVHHTASSQLQGPFGNGARLQMLGEPMLKMAYVTALREKRPNLSADQLMQYIDINYPVFVAHWVNAYGWKTRMRVVPEGVDLDDPDEARMIFERYAGAVVKECVQEPGDRRGDPRILFQWIQQLLFISD